MADLIDLFAARNGEERASIVNRALAAWLLAPGPLGPPPPELTPHRWQSADDMSIQNRTDARDRLETETESTAPSSVVDLREWAHDRGYDEAAEEMLFKRTDGKRLRELRGDVFGSS